MIKVGIVGASGYSGEELVRLLSRHPRAELARVTSRTLAGKPVVSVMPQLRGALPASLAFTASEPEALAADAGVDVWFLALPHGVAVEFAKPLLKAGRKVIDLSADFRLRSAAIYEEFYGHHHPAPELLAEAAYVIPELHGTAWKSGKLIACPGCYPTSILSPLIPLLREKVISTSGIVVNSFSGVSGAGKKVAEDYLYCERDSSAKAYGLPKHRHLSEVEEQLGFAANDKVTIQFNPHLAPMRRGIATTITVPAFAPSVDRVYELWNKTFAGRPFVGILPSGTCPDTAHVVGTNRVDMSAVYDPRTRNFVITSAIDNLLKGASGQAVQILNVWHGFAETDGLL